MKNSAKRAGGRSALTETRRKLNEAKFFLDCMQHQTERFLGSNMRERLEEVFDYYWSAFLSAAISVPDVFCHEDRNSTIGLMRRANRRSIAAIGTC